MSIPVFMPQLGESVAEGTVIEWLKEEGERVQKDEAILAISTEKVDAEIPAPATGVLSQILVKAGEVAPVGATLAIIAEGFASGTGIELGSEAPIMVPPPTAAREAEGVRREAKPEEREKRFYSPAVRKLAEELGVNLEEVPGTGEGGRVTRRDLEVFVHSKGARPVAKDAAPRRAPEAHVEPAGEELIPLTKMRRTIAEHMVRSVQTAPHVTS
ncbi:MAG TPA: biotin/lipoyl-containing protein, partial [Candidatus Methylomirabilis sp.]|nr:biotin/lipoyl-containing protein [Candidatus Methylomirabilis sp.]